MRETDLARQGVGQVETLCEDFPEKLMQSIPVLWFVEPFFTTAGNNILSLAGSSGRSLTKQGCDEAALQLPVGNQSRCNVVYHPGCTNVLSDDTHAYVHTCMQISRFLCVAH